MYLYFDEYGVLKEIINDGALRQGNYGVNTVFIYIENRTVNTAEVSFLLPSGTTIGPDLVDTFETAEIPFNQKRDLRFFEYYKEYRFIEISLSPEEGPGPLDEAGLVHMSVIVNPVGGEQLGLGDVNFMVEENSVLQQKYVAEEQYLSLADYQYLKKLIDWLPQDNSVTTDKIANNAVTNAKIANGAISNEKIDPASIRASSLDIIREKLSDVLEGVSTIAGLYTALRELIRKPLVRFFEDTGNETATMEFSAFSLLGAYSIKYAIGGGTQTALTSDSDIPSFLLSAQDYYVEYINA